MIENNSGITALSGILEKARLTVIETNGLIPTQKALWMSFFNAGKGEDTVCIIPERETDELEYVEENNDKLMRNAAIVIITLGTVISRKLVHKMCGFGIHIFIPDSLQVMCEMIHDAVIYSKVAGTVCTVYVSHDLAYRRESISMDGRCRDEINTDGLKEREAERIINEIESKYYTVEGQGEKIIVTSGDAYQYVKLIAGDARVALCNVRYINPFKKPMPPNGKKYMYVGPLSSFLADSAKDNFIVDVDMNKITAPEIIRDALERFLKNVSDRKTDQEQCAVRMPSLPQRNNVMCAGCPYREKIRRRLEVRNSKDEHVESGRIRKSRSAGVDNEICVYEKIYCEELGMEVRSGFANTDDYYAADVIFTNVTYGKFDPVKILWIEGKCDRPAERKTSGGDGNMEHYMTVDKTLCNGCEVCMDTLKCPAIYKRGRRVIIDPTECSMCGACTGICPRHAIHADEQAVRWLHSQTPLFIR